MKKIKIILLSTLIFMNTGLFAANKTLDNDVVIAEAYFEQLEKFCGDNENMKVQNLKLFALHYSSIKNALLIKAPRSQNQPDLRKNSNLYVDLNKAINSYDGQPASSTTSYKPHDTRTRPQHGR